MGDAEEVQAEVDDAVIERCSPSQAGRLRALLEGVVGVDALRVMTDQGIAHCVNEALRASP